MKNMKILKVFTFLSVIASAICYFAAPYLQYPKNSWNSSDIIYETLSCADIFYNADKFGINSIMMNGLIALVIISIILAIVLLINKKNYKDCFMLIVMLEIVSVVLNGYLFYSFDTIKKRYAGILGVLIDSANIKFVYGIYLNIFLAVFAIVLSLIGTIKNDYSIDNTIIDTDDIEIS